MKKLELTEYPLSVGERVTLDGKVRTVTGRPGPYSVVLDDYIFASVTFFTKDVTDATSQPEEPLP